jgi:mRNA interferase RelE/StbE
MREIERLPVVDKLRIEAAVDRLQDTPRPQGIKALEQGVYRLRIGRYRVIYSVDDTEREVVVEAVSLRNERTYRH